MHANIRNRHWLGLLAFGVVTLLIAVGCSSDENEQPPPSVEQAGQSCSAPTQCYANIEAGALKGGAVQCLDRVPGGYCTHLCSSDADCCAVPGECRTGFKQVCAPFESTGQQMCFLSCEDADVTSASDAGTTDATLYCQRFADSAFGCRSTGGGKNNRKVCVP